ncbi:MAG TPA: WD40 repeat domain-containing protein [Gemmataceae bacterium]|jgi:WD40 repeat protein|nr:WD40 repeat domain-containing protein [Gemmataceae bacterium]
MARLTTPPRPEIRWRQAVGDHVIALGWSPDGNTLAAASVAGPVTLFDITTGAVRHELAGHGFGTTALSWHPDGKTLATAGQDGKVRLWDVATGQERTALEGGAAWVEHIAWAPKGDYLVSAAGKKVRLWNPDGTPAQAIPDHPATVSDAAWSPRRKEFALSGYGGVTIVQPNSADAPKTFPWKSSILSVAWSPDGAMLAGGAQDASVHFWYVKSGEDLQMSGYPTKVRELAWDPKSRFLATGGGEMLIVWDCSGKGPAGSEPLVYELHERPITALAYQRRGPVVVSACSAGRLGFWWPEGSKKTLATAEVGEGVSRVAWSPGEGRLAVGGETGGVIMLTV